MSRLSFNVLHEPWIPVVRLDGSREEIGIYACLTQAYELREIRDPSPIIEFGLYRLLVAFMLDVFISANQRPADVLDLKTLIKPGHFDTGLLDEYIASCGDVFDLFDEHRPFLQSAGAKGSGKPLAGMYPAIPSGTNSGLWHHFHEDSACVTPAEAARMLTTLSPFMTAGGAGLSPSINGAPAIYSLPLGQSLYQTIMLNLPTDNNDSGAGQVAWREKRLPGTDRTQATMVEALTWRPRIIQLLGTRVSSGATVVREMKFEKGDSTRLEWQDPNLAYRFDKDKVTPIRMREGRPLWREAGPLALLHKGDHGQGEDKLSFYRPTVVENAFGVTDEQSDLSIKAYGMRTDMKMKVFEWTASELHYPAKLGRSTSLGRALKLELDRAEKASFYLRMAIKGLYPREGAGNKSAMGTVCDRAERTYWQQLENQFNPLMSRFSELGDDAPSGPALMESAVRPWRERINNLAKAQFELAAQDMDADSDALERGVRARGKLSNLLRKELE
jgi:CRISPR system Cascade subunit CasA